MFFSNVALVVLDVLAKNHTIPDKSPNKII